MTRADPVRVLVVGDPYMPAAIFAAALARLGDAITVTELHLATTHAPPPRTASERSLREYMGDPAVLAAAMPGHQVLLVHGAPVSAEVLDAAPLRLVCCARGGPVNVDVAAASARGIPVTSAPGRNAGAVAELTMAFALMLIRGVPASARYLTDGGPLGGSTYEGSQFIGGEAASMTLGLVGMGHVGREVAARARALGFTVLGYDPVPPESVPPGVTMVAFDDLLSRSDLVSVHARATDGNRHMFRAAAFARMPRGAMFINTARESLVDEDALASALASGTLAGAALDVAEPRPAGDRHPLLDLPNVIITPHIGGATRETLRRGAQMAVAAVASLITGEVPDHLVNPEVLARQEGPG
ncbi:MAG TPA: NAD(P)-dependent oxidoreductase [Streptosporangiaceae bacterium]|nr:NAD(P)-dependent oxidoreductase [Streptosporangiaceae bacterium]